ncbi:MAG: hypothetical protein QNJ68_11350 [Microcoleaceae cyanobacterium MO_207.B10]|nr:hypothetical protein [Microcoleaceae cyanobacterium MO_207.B10]
MKSISINQTKTANQSQSALNDLEIWLTLVEIDLVIQEIEYFTGDDWLPLCDDIDSGEIYHNWFIWQDREVSQEWEAYDHVTNQRIIYSNLTQLKSRIDAIENHRNLQINN